MLEPLELGCDGGNVWAVQLLVLLGKGGYLIATIIRCGTCSVRDNIRIVKIVFI